MEKTEESKIKVSRTFDAPLDLMWKSWTEAERFMQWYGPRGFTTPMCEINFEIGGRHFWSMRSADGKEMFSVGTYEEIVPMDYFVYTDAMADAEGNAISPQSMGMGDDMPEAMVVTVRFSHDDGKTTVTVSHAAYGPNGDRAAVGWEQALEKLSAQLQN